MANAKQYTIFTERTNVEGIEALLNKHLAGYTLTECTGTWRGTKEASLRIDIVIFDFDAERFAPYLSNGIHEICDEIRTINHQETVLLIEQNINAELV